MRPIAEDPIQSLALLPLDGGEQIERQWLQDSLRWLKNMPPDRRTEGLRLLAVGMDKLPDTRRRFQQIWRRACPARLLSEAGLPEATSLPREWVARLTRRVLPHVEDELDLYAALHTMDLNAADARWVAGLDDAMASAWGGLLGNAEPHILAAIRMLAVRAASIGLLRGILQAMPQRCASESPVMNLVDAAERFAQFPNGAARDALRICVLECQSAAVTAFSRLEQSGVSSDLVFRLDLQLAQMQRMDALLRMHAGELDPRRFAAMLAGSFAEERGLHHLVRSSVNRVARQIVTHTGRSGEHYIADSPKEWWRMGYGALGAGAITAFTALFKYVFAAIALAPLWIGIAHSLNYAASFVLMQFLGWMLASKMPSMTAAALSAAMERDDGMRSEIELVSAITRTQAIVTIANLLGAIPAAIVIDTLMQWTIGNPFLTTEAALHGVRSLHPWHSWTILFAALTGAFLWVSSLAAGWTANWLALHRLPAAIAQSRRLRRSFGTEGALELARIVEHHCSGVIGYTCLGVLLGLIPFVSVFAGIPLEVRHITLAGASLAYAASSLAWTGALPWSDLAWAMAGLAATGLMNFGVSFALGLWLAMRARNLDTRGRHRFVTALWRELRRDPARFLWRFPRRDSSAP